MEKAPCIYITANKRNGTLYIGVTSDLIKRIHQHKSKIFDGFSKKYGCDILVHYEVFADMENPEWEDLYDGLI